MDNNWPFFVESHVDQTGHVELSFVGLGIDPKVISGAEKISEFLKRVESSLVICWDVRPLFKLGLSKKTDFIDMKSAVEWDGDLLRYAKQSGNDYASRLEHSTSVMNAHRKAIIQSKIDLNTVKISDCIPDDVRHSFYRYRIWTLSQAWSDLVHEKKSFVFDDWMQLHRRTLLDLIEIDDTGIRVDVEFVKSQFKRMDLAHHEKKFFEHVRQNHVDGFVRTKTSPTGAKTHRFRTVGGFNAMGIPKGECRKAIVSRFPGGSIVSLDFNAIDYRCIISQVPQLKEMFKNYRDFHLRTASVFDEAIDRSLVKSLTYSHVYGGSQETVSRVAGIPLQRTRELLEVLDFFFQPITEFREELARKSKRDGFLVTPGGFRVEIAGEDHPGKILGLYAQTHSSMVFRRALHLVIRSLVERKMKSRVIFTVHDEIVIDAHPNEVDWLGPIQSDIEIATGFVVKLQKGVNYHAATN